MKLIIIIKSIILIFIIITTIIIKTTITIINIILPIPNYKNRDLKNLHLIPSTTFTNSTMSIFPINLLNSVKYLSSTNSNHRLHHFYF